MNLHPEHDAMIAEPGPLTERLRQYGDGLPAGLLLMREAADALEQCAARAAPAGEPVDERAAFEKWAVEDKYAFRDDKHGLCFYDSSAIYPAWNAWQARAALSTSSEPVPETA